MPASARDAQTLRALRTLVARRRSGRVTVGAGSAEISAWLLDGELVAVRAGDDTRQILARLTREGQLTASRALALQAPPPEGAARRATSSDPHDAPLTAWGRVAEEVEPAAFDRVLRERFHENVCRLLGSQATPVFAPDETPWAENLRFQADTTQWLDVCATDWDRAHALTDRRQLQAGPTPGHPDADPRVLAAIARGPTLVSTLLTALGLEDVRARLLLLDQLDRGVLAYVEVPAAPPPDPALAARGASPRSLFDDEAFAGTLDASRGHGIGGAFFVSHESDDRVEITTEEPNDLSEVEDEDSEDDESIPTHPVETSFAAPSLSERDALAKLAVANDVLRPLAAAIDAAQGPGRGSAVVQLLVDARPRAFALLLEGVRVSPSGALPTDDVLDNLRSRPPAEQRRMLHDGMLDLIERMLDRTADELPEDALEAALRHASGYRQRLGL